MEKTNKTSYDKIADSWQTERNKSVINRCVVEFAEKIKHGGSVLDIGCGTGYPITEYLSERGFTLTGVDFSANMIEKARALKLKNAVFIECDIFDFESAATYDAVIAFDSLFHVSRDRQAEIYKKIAGFLKPGGYFLFTHGKKNGTVEGEMFGEPFRYAALDVDEVHKILSDSGLKIEQSIEDYAEKTTGARDLLITAKMRTP